MSRLAVRRSGVDSIAGAISPQRVVARVNLLPREVLAARQFKKTQGWLAAAVIVVVFVITGVYLLSVNQRNDAQDQLAASQATGRTLKAEEAKYADVPRVMAAIDAAQQARETMMAQDVEWYRYLTGLSLTIPNNAWLTSMQVNLSQSPTGGAAPAAGAAAGANPLATAGIGQITFQGTALDHPDVAAWLDMLAKQPGYADPYFSSSAKAKIGSKDVVNYSSTVTVTPGALSHRYDRKAG